jgi:hypothetical protein
MMENAHHHSLVPTEIYSERVQTADDGTLAKILAYDAIRQTQLPAGIASVDADSCFDRLVHPIASLIFQVLAVNSQALKAMLSTIQEMKIFLRNAYGNSKNFANSEIELKTQGLCQGSGAAGARWAAVSICIIQAHKRKGHGETFVFPISELKTNIAGVIYVDDKDIIDFKTDKTEDAADALFHLQSSINNWGKLLIATGGSLKPEKCFFYLISFTWKPDGT